MFQLIEATVRCGRSREGEDERGGQTTPRRPTMLSILARKLPHRPSNNITMDAPIVRRARARASPCSQILKLLRDSVRNCLGRSDLRHSIQLTPIGARRPKPASLLFRAFHSELLVAPINTFHRSTRCLSIDGTNEEIAGGKGASRAHRIPRKSNFRSNIQFN